LSEIEKKLRLYSYCRVSTKEQKLENQRRSIKSFIKHNNKRYEIVESFEEEASAFKDRKEYNKMLNMLYNKENNIDGVIIQRLDRIGRSTKDLANLIDMFIKNNKKLITTEQNFNMDTIEGKLLVGLLSVIAEFNANLFKERSKEGRERYLAEKDSNGNPKNKWGRSRIEIPEKTKKEVIKLYNLGLGTTKLSKYLIGEGIKITPNTVYLRLKEWNVLKANNCIKLS
jgi:DNA invertase Pin-like site-specific DNA recombinase